MKVVVEKFSLEVLLEDRTLRGSCWGQARLLTAEQAQALESFVLMLPRPSETPWNHGSSAPMMATSFDNVRRIREFWAALVAK